MVSCAPAQKHGGFFRSSVEQCVKASSSLCMILSCLVIVGCSSPNLGPLTPPPSQTTPFTIDTRTLSFETNVLGPTTNEDLNFVLDNYERWAHNHFIANGMSGKAVLTLDTLTVQDRQNNTPPPSEGLIPSAKTHTISAQICLKLVLYSENSRSHKERFFEGRATASHTYSNNVTLLEREKILDSISNRLIAALTRQFASIKV